MKVGMKPVSAVHSTVWIEPLLPFERSGFGEIIPCRKYVQQERKKQYYGQTNENCFNESPEKFEDISQYFQEKRDFEAERQR